MEKIKEIFGKLGTIPSIIILIIVIALGMFLLDSFTGVVRDAKNWMFDRQQAENTAKVEQLLKENEDLRKVQKEYETKALIAESKNQIYEQRAEEIGGKILAEQQKLDKALEEAKKEELTTEQPTDKLTRCNRLKEKLLAQNIPSAKDIDCNAIK